MRASFIVRLFIALVVVSGLVLVGCAAPAASPTESSAPATTKATSTTTPPAPTATKATGPYGDLRIGLISFGGESTNPAKATSTNKMNLFPPMLDSLVRMNGNELVPGLAERWEMSPDGMSWIFYIRKGIKFHNGEDLTAEDVQYSLDWARAKDAIYTDLRLAVERIEINDDYSVRIFTIGQQPYLPYFFLDGYEPGAGWIVPKDYVEKNGIPYFERYPVGTGPFKFVRHNLGDTIEFEALNSHWRQVPAFKKLALILVPEETTRIAMFKTGQLDAIDVSVEGAEELESLGLRTFPMTQNVATYYLHGTYDPRTAGLPTSDVRVRQALSLAINREEIRKTFFLGKAEPPVCPGLSAASADIDVKYWTEVSAKYYRYDAEEAKRLLKEAGYPDGFNLKIYTYTVGGGAYLPKLAEVIQGYWTKIGVKVAINQVDQGAYKSIRTSEPGRLPARELLGQVSTMNNSPLVFTGKRLWTVYHTAGSVNLLGTGGVSEYDKLIESTMTETDTAKRKELIARMIKAGMDSYVDAPIGIVPDMSALGPRVDIGFIRPAMSISLFADIAKHRGS